MAILNFFKNNEVFKEKFKVTESEPIEIGDFQELKNQVDNNLENLQDKLREFKLSKEPYCDFKGNKILIKGFSYEGNLNIYGFLGTKKEAIKKAIEVLKTLNSSVEIKVASEVTLDGLYCKKPSKETIEFETKAFVKEYFGEVDSKSVLIMDLLDLVYLGEAFLNGQANDFLYLSVFGSAVTSGKIVKVKIGTTLKEIFNALEGKESLLTKIVAGGVITGTVKSSLEEVILGNEKGLLFLTAEDENRKKESPCIRCAKCLRICPKSLNPTKLAELWRIGDKEEFIKFGGGNCISCGLCSYTCPSKIELSHKIFSGKRIFIEKEKVNNEKVRGEQLV